MKKVYLFAENTNTEFLKDLDFVTGKLEIVPFQGLNAAEALSANFDSILLGEGDYEFFKPLLKGVSYKTNHLGVADTLLKTPAGYKPLNLNADCILQVLKDRHFKLDTSHTAMVIGTYDFVLSVTLKIALSGYSHIIVFLPDKTSSAQLAKNIKNFVFNLNVQSIELNDLTRLQTTSGILISNLNATTDKEAFESLTYFNFLSHGAIFVDFQSYGDAGLIEEARRAELNVVEELEILTLKFKSLI